MPDISVRESGVAGAVIGDDDLCAGIIVDGHHVHQLNIILAYRAMGVSRLFLVSDAMPSLAGQSSTFELSGKVITLCEGRLVDDTSTLAGAHLAMDEAVRNIIEYLSITPAEALKMASSTPANAVGLGNELGQLRAGWRASVTALDEELRPLGVMVDGVYFDHGDSYHQMEKAAAQAATP